MEAGAAKMSPLYRVVAILLAACIAVVDGYVETPLNSVTKEAHAGAYAD
jgi:hypothetical protein